MTGPLMRPIVSGYPASLLTSASGVCVGLAVLLDHLERGAEQAADPLGLAGEPLALVLGAPADRAGFGVRLGEDRLALLARGLELLLRGPLGRDEGLAEQRLELPVTLELVLEELDPVLQVGAVAPHCGVARLDLLEVTIDDRAAVADEASPDLQMVDLDWRDGHRGPPS